MDRVEADIDVRELGRERGASDLATSTRQIPFVPAPDRTWLPTIRTFWELFRWI